MGRLLLATASALLGAVVALGACGNDYAEDTPGTPAPTSETPAQGALDGACYPNSTCNDALVCLVVSGQARCRPRDASTDASSPGADADASALDAAETAPPISGECSFNPASTGCGVKPVACISSASVTCHSETEVCDDSSDLRWECTSRRNCATAACCLSSANLNKAPKCEVASMTVGISKTTCRNECEPLEVRMCVSSVDCKAGERCQPYVVKSQPGSLTNKTFGICASN